MRIEESKIKGAFYITPELFGDDRGYFFESFNEKQFNEMTGADFHPVQDNESKSSKGIFRGMHFQKPPYAQAKLVRVVSGMALDYAADMRPDSPTYGMFTYCLLRPLAHNQFFIPKGCAHGFLALEDDTVFQYKCDNYYNKESEGNFSYKDMFFRKDLSKALPPYTLYDDIKYVMQVFGIDHLNLSEKDANASGFLDIENPFDNK